MASTKLELGASPAARLPLHSLGENRQRASFENPMAIILIAPLPVPGHVNPSLRIARALKASGHRVIYLSIREIEDQVRAEGFEFEAAFGEVFPAGTFARFRAQATQMKGPRLLWFVRKHIQQINRLLQGMIEGELDELLTRLNPDLLICDEKMRHLSVIAFGKRIPVLQMNVTIPPAFIPKESTRMPAAAGTSRLGHWLRASTEQLMMTLGLMPRLRDSLIQLARKHSYPLKDGGSTPQLDPTLSPQLLLCPKEFAEVRIQSNPGEFYYIEPCIDLDRREPDFPWDRLEKDKLLVLFSLGTLAFGSKHNMRLVQSAFSAAAQRPQWQFVIAVGASVDPAAFNAPPNVIAVKVAPQLALLQRATVMINHGGTNSVKECIYFGVPMVSIPLQYDQPDIGRLVEFHGVGATIPPPEVTADRLLALLDEVIRNPQYKHACEKMQARFRESEASQGATATIERFLQERGAPRQQLAAS